MSMARMARKASGRALTAFSLAVRVSLRDGAAIGGTIVNEAAKK